MGSNIQHDLGISVAHPNEIPRSGNYREVLMSYKNRPTRIWRLTERQLFRIETHTMSLSGNQLEYVIKTGQIPNSRYHA